MTTFENSKNRNDWSGVRIALMALVLVGVAACGQAMMHRVRKPAASEFGMGPRTSAKGLYVATLQSAEPLRTRKLQTLQVSIADPSGAAVEGATIGIDGGMPQHGHGLPTQPRVTGTNGNGVYVIEGVRFNMGGWWEFKVAVDGPAGPDTITFNLAL
ncbi:MAG: FixH family protein [Acidobacteriota bacterium]